MDLHNRLMNDKWAFADLARNQDGEVPYIAVGCREKFYHWHMRVVELLFGKGAKFEDHAAVTELFFCASRNAKQLPIADSPCANFYFERVFLKVRPIVVFCVWKSVLKYFQKRARTWDRNSFLLTLGDHTALVVYIPQ